MLHIISAPHPILSKQAKKVSKIDKSVQNLLEEMKETLLATTDPVGVGLAAPQVAKSLRIFIAKQSTKAPFQIFINPEILSQEPLETTDTNKSKDKHGVKLEGCLSLPSIWGEVQRHPKLQLRFMDEHGKSHTKTFSGFMAIIIQHEIDHLDGILFPKRVLDQQGKLYKSHKNTKGEDEFEELDI